MKKILSLMLLCAAVLFASCSKDDNNGDVAVKGVMLDQPTLSLKVDETATLVATVAPENADNQTVTWSSNKTDIATVNDAGVVTAMKVGTATITATTEDGNFTATCEVTVNLPDYVEVNGIKWAIGNLVADGANGAKIGTATDKGLYFQFGSLIGWSETGSPTIAVKPANFNGAEGWTTTGKIWLGTEGTVPFTAAGSDNEKAGIGDPCRYYLKGTWRLPTKDEYVKLFENNGYPSTGPWKWENSSATNSTLNLTFPASGFRGISNGNLDNVGAAGYYWSASPKSAIGYSLNFDSSNVYPSDNYDRPYGWSVRCVRESN